MAGEAGHVRLAEEGPVGYEKAGSFEGFAAGEGLRGWPGPWQRMLLRQAVRFRT